MLAICPNKSHPDWIRFVEEFGEDYAFLTYDFLGGRIPSEKEFNAVKNGAKLSATNNQRVWDVQNNEGLIERWHTVDGRSEPVLNKFFEKKADNDIATLRRKYYKDKIGFEKGTPVKVDGKWRYPIITTDKTVVMEGLSELHIVRNFQRADIAAEQAAMEAETQSVPFKSNLKITIGEGELDHDQYESDVYPIYINNKYAGRFSITARDGTKNLPSEKKGFITGSIGTSGIELEQEFIGKGYGTLIYINIGNKLAEEGIKMKSEFLGKDSISPVANKIWNNLIQQGYAEDKGSYYEFTPKVEESRTLEGIQTKPEYMAQAEEKIKVFQRAVPSVEDVIFDETIPTVALVEAGGKTIRVNPKLMTTDSIGHEYGHILIDLLGGMSNTLVQRGREQLKGTKVEKAVMEAYPDLVAQGDDRIDKEILTTAVGLKAAEIWEDREIQNRWTRWLVRFFRRLRAMLGIESSVVLKLAQRLVAGQQLQTQDKATNIEVREGLYIQGRPSIYDQYSKRLEGTLTLVNEMIKQEEAYRTKAALVLQKKLDVLSKKGRNTAEYEALEKTLPRLQGTNTTKSLLHMIRFAVQSTKEMNDKYVSYLHRERFPLDNPSKKDVMTAKLLSEWRTSVAAWDMLEDLKKLYVETKDNIDVMGEDIDRKSLKQLYNDNKPLLEITLGKERFKELSSKKDVTILDMFIELLEEAIRVKNKIQDIYIRKGKELMVDFLFPYVNHIKVMKREEYEKEWLALSKEEKAATPRDTYINKKVIDNKDRIEQETRDLILRELGKAESDVGFLTRYVDTILDSRDVISSALARSVFDIQEQSNRDILAWKYKFVDNLKALEKMMGRTPSMPDEKFWDWMLETDPENGRLMQTIISELPSKLVADYEAYAETVWSPNLRKNNGEKATNAEKGRMLRKWMEEHAPRDREAWIQAQLDVVAQMRADGLIDKDEDERFGRNVRVKYASARQPIVKIFKNQDAIDTMDSFYERNRWTYRTPSGYYDKLNTKWKAFVAMREKGLKNGVQTDPRVIWYDFITEVLDEAAARLPGKYSLTTELPSMMKGFGQRYRATAKFGLSKVDFLKQELSAKFTKRSTDEGKGLLEGQAEEEGLNSVGKEELAKAGSVEEYSEKTELVNEAGEPVYFLPIYYTQNKNKDRGKWLPLADQSFDVGSLYFNYLKMAIDFGHKYKLLAELEMVNYFIDNREVIRRDGKNNIIVDSTAKKVLSIGESIRDKALTDSGKKSMLAAQVMDFMKSNIYGMEKDEEPDLSLLGFTIDRAKLLDSINSFTALNLLGVNFVAGIANLNLGELTQLTESFAGMYTTTKDLKNATGYYYKNLGGIVKDIGMRRPENIVSLLNERFNTLNEEIDGKINLNSRFANLMNTNTLFFTSHAGEHYMQTRFMLAMLKTLRAYDEQGNDIGDMLSHISVDEETKTLKIDKEVVNFTEKDQNDFSAKLHRVLSSMHGEYSKIGQSSLQRTALGRMGILFRRFVVPGFKRRWERKGINNLLDDYTEGYYRTFGRIAKQFMIDLTAFKREAMVAHSRGMTKLEKANMIRFTGEMLAFATVLVATGMVMRAKRADDDKDNWILNNAAYQLLRLRSELMFFLNPQATMQILRSPMASISLFENTLKLIGQLFYPVYSGTFEFQRYQQGAWKDHLKLEKTVSSILPVYKQYYRIRDIEDQLSWFNQ